MLMQDTEKETANNVKTGWTRATTDPHVALMGLVTCLEAGNNAWIELRKNGDQNFPIMMKNPALDNPFNWQMAYGTPRNRKELEEEKFFNDTEKDMTFNWIACFGEKKAIEAYQKDGTILKGLCNGADSSHPVKIEDANRYRREIVGDNYQYEYWVTHWKPKDGIPYWILDESVGEVFTVCYTDGPVDKKEALKRAAQFLLDYAERV